MSSTDPAPGAERPAPPPDRFEQPSDLPAPSDHPTSPARSDTPGATGSSDPAGDVELTELLQQTLRRHRRGVRGRMGPAPPPLHQLRALRLLAAQGPMRPGRLAEDLGIAPRSATGVVDALEQRGLVERSPDPHDRRAQVVAPTPQARLVLVDAARAQADAARELVAPLGPHDRAELARLLRLLADRPEDRS